MTDFIIQVQDVSKTVTTLEGQLRILHNISFQLEAGKSFAVSGPSGSGKSTLLALLAGLDRPDSGSIVVDGMELATMDEDQLATMRAGRVGFVFQNFQLLPHLSALENVLIPLEFDGNYSTREAEQAAIAALRQVGLGERLKYRANRLSGGEQQRVAIARAYAGKPRIVFADEPTSNLDHVSNKRVAELLFTLCSEYNSTLVIVTHDTSLAGRCDMHAVLTEGEIKSSDE